MSRVNIKGTIRLEYGHHSELKYSAIPVLLRAPYQRGSEIYMNSPIIPQTALPPDNTQTSTALSTSKIIGLSLVSSVLIFASHFSSNHKPPNISGFNPVSSAAFWFFVDSNSSRTV